MRAFVWYHELGAKTVWIAESVESAREMQKKCGDCDNKQRNPWGWAICNNDPSYTVSLPCHMTILEGSIYS